MRRFNSCILFIQALLCVYHANAFDIRPLRPSGVTSCHLDPRVARPCKVRHGVASELSSRLFARVPKDDYDDDDEFDERELVKVPRGGRRRGKYYNDEADNDDYDVASNRRASFFDQDDYEQDDDDDEEEFDEEELDKEIADLFENVVLPNPLLDSMDPDGAADRFLPELARDPRFWFDFALFIAFLNFLSFAGPRDTLSDLPWWT